MSHPWMKRHKEFLAGVDGWFASVRCKHANHVMCGRGCALCCRGLFDISLPDALVLAEGLSALTPENMASARANAEIIQAGINDAASGLKTPHFVNALGEAQMERIVDQANGPRCPLLGPDNRCLVYEHRPLACRLEGLPMVDVNDGLFGDWCELNFTNGVQKEALDDLRLDYYELQEVEQIATEILSDALLGERRRDVTVFIASVVADFEDYWKRLTIS